LYKNLALPVSSESELGAPPQASPNFDPLVVVVLVVGDGDGDGDEEEEEGTAAWGDGDEDGYVASGEEEEACGGEALCLQRRVSLSFLTRLS
jgi:hypothetical protein